MLAFGIGCPLDGVDASSEATQPVSLLQQQSLRFSASAAGPQRARLDPADAGVGAAMSGGVAPWGLGPEFAALAAAPASAVPGASVQPWAVRPPVEGEAASQAVEVVPPVVSAPMVAATEALQAVAQEEAFMLQALQKAAQARQAALAKALQARTAVYNVVQNLNKVVLSDVEQIEAVLLAQSATAGLSGSADLLLPQQPQLFPQQQQVQLQRPFLQHQQQQLLLPQHPTSPLQQLQQLLLR